MSKPITLTNCSAYLESLGYIECVPDESINPGHFRGYLVNWDSCEEMHQVGYELPGYFSFAKISQLFWRAVFALTSPGSYRHEYAKAKIALLGKAELQKAYQLKLSKLERCVRLPNGFFLRRRSENQIALESNLFSSDTRYFTDLSKNIFTTVRQKTNKHCVIQ